MYGQLAFLSNLTPFTLEASLGAGRKAALPANSSGKAGVPGATAEIAADAAGDHADTDYTDYTDAQLDALAVSLGWYADEQKMFEAEVALHPELVSDDYAAFLANENADEEAADETALAADEAPPRSNKEAQDGVWNWDEAVWEKTEEWVDPAKVNDTDASGGGGGAAVPEGSPESGAEAQQLQGVEKDGAPFDAEGGAGAEAVQLEDVEKGFLGMWAHEYQVRHATPSPGAPPPPSPAVLNNNQGAIIEAMRADADEHGKDLPQGLETNAATGALARAAARAATEDIERTEVGLDSSKKIWWGGDRTCMGYI